MSLTDQLVEQRWFASKAREIAHCDVVERIDLRDGLQATFIDTVFSAGTHETYQLLVADGSEEDVLAERAGVLLALIREGADVEQGESVIHFRHLAEIGDVAEPRPVGAEQSNSSVVFGDELILKVFRRVEPGINPDLEISRFL